MCTPNAGSLDAEVVNILQSQQQQTLKLNVAFREAQEYCTDSFMEWVPISEV